MATTISFDVGGLDDALRGLAAIDPKTRRAALRAGKKTLAWVKTHTGRRIADAHRLPVKAMKERVKTKAPTRQKPTGRAWVGVESVAPRIAGAVRQTKTGARAGRHAFPGAFVATTWGGYTSVFKRSRNASRWSTGRPTSSSPNLPINERRIPLTEAVRIVNAIEREGGERYRELMAQEINYELNVKGGK